MNLFDIVRRKDRALIVTSGSVESAVRSFHGRKCYAVCLATKSSLRLERACEFQVLRTFPKKLNLGLMLEGRGNGRFKLDIVSAGARRRTLFEAQLSADDAPLDMDLAWPVWAGDSEGFDIEIDYCGNVNLLVITGLAFNPRQQLLPLLRGVGVEVGPGLNPHVLPSGEVSVSYVEALSADQWVTLYKKQDKPSKAQTDNLWANYVVDNAHDLATFGDESLDFVFANHVFEHLVNPLGVLENWGRKLKPAGVIAGVIPDCRFTFDLRQPLSSLDELKLEWESNSYEVGYEKYVRWCRFTAPYNTPEDLIARKYSIHVHYYTPERFADLVDVLVQRRLFCSAFYDTSPNNKDFGFILRKP